MVIYKIFLFALKFLNIVSAIAFVLTAIVYAITPAIKDVQGKCIFHYSLNFGLNHLLDAVLVIEFHEECDLLFVIQLYVSIYFTIVGFTWMHLLSFNTWRVSKNKIQTNSIMRCYYTLGYGVPLLLICLILLEAYYLTDFGKYLECYHIFFSRVFRMVYGYIAAMIAVSIFYFVDAQCYLWKMQKYNQSSRIKAIIYRFVLFFKMFVIMGCPWMIMLIFGVFKFSLNSFFRIILLIISAEGLTFFFTMVVLRKKILRYLFTRKYCGREIFPINLRNIADDPESEEDIIENDPEANYCNPTDRT